MEPSNSRPFPPRAVHTFRETIDFVWLKRVAFFILALFNCKRLKIGRVHIIFGIVEIEKADSGPVGAHEYVTVRYFKGHPYVAAVKFGEGSSRFFRKRILE